MVANSVADFDVVIRNGRVVDGTGAESRIADVAIKGSVIVAVEPNLAGQVNAKSTQRAYSSPQVGLTTTRTTTAKSAGTNG